MQPSLTFSCLVAINGRMGSKSLADFPELRTISLMQPTKDSIMYFTPCNRSSELSPVKNREKKNDEDEKKCPLGGHLKEKLSSPPIRTTEANSSDTP